MDKPVFSPRFKSGYVTSNNKLFDTVQEACREEIREKLLNVWFSDRTIYGLNPDSVVKFIEENKELIAGFVNGT